MLVINLNEHDQGPHWLSGPAKERQRKINERVAARMRERHKNDKPKKRPKKSAEPSGGETDEH